MELLQFFSFFLVLTFVLVVVAFFMIVKRKEEGPKTTQKPMSKTPPGPWKLPLIGNLHHLLVGLPHHSFTKLAQKHGPIMHLQLGDFSTIVISSANLAKEVMKTHDTSFLDRPESLAVKILTYECQNMAFAPYGKYWRQMRKICTLQLLSAKRVQSFRSLREKEVESFIRGISQVAGSVVNISERVFSLSNDITATAAFGKKCKDQEAFLSAMHEALKMAGVLGLVDIFPSMKLLHLISIRTKRKLEAIHLKIDNILDSILEEHRENIINPKTKGGHGELINEDLVDILLSIQKGSGDPHFPLKATNLKAIIGDMFVGGSDTSATAIEWAMSELIRNPTAMKKAQEEVRRFCNGKTCIKEEDIQELNYLKFVIKETLRLHPPLPLLLPRECRERCEIEGYEIPEKTRVIVNAWAIGRDPECWKDAESFKPERFDGACIDFKGNNFEYIPFGAGRRICPGSTFGLASVELALAQLLYHFDWELPNGMKLEELDMSEVFGATVRRQNDLKLIPKSYSSSLI